MHGIQDLYDVANFEKFCRKHLARTQGANTRRGIAKDLPARLNARCPNDHAKALASASPDFQLLADQFVKPRVIDAVQRVQIPVRPDSLAEFVKTHMEFISQKKDQVRDSISAPFRMIHENLQKLFRAPLDKLAPEAYLTVVALVYIRFFDETNYPMNGLEATDGIYDTVVASLSAADHSQGAFQSLPHIIRGFVRILSGQKLEQDVKYQSEIFDLIENSIKANVVLGRMLPEALYEPLVHVYSSLQQMPSLAITTPSLEKVLGEMFNPPLRNLAVLQTDAFYTVKWNPRNNRDSMHQRRETLRQIREHVKGRKSKMKLDILNRIMAFQNEDIFNVFVKSLHDMPQFFELLARNGTSSMITAVRWEGIDFPKTYYKHLVKRAESDALGKTPFRKEYVVDMLRRYSLQRHVITDIQNWPRIQLPWYDMQRKQHLGVPVNFDIDIERIRDYIMGTTGSDSGKAIILSLLPEEWRSSVTSSKPKTPSPIASFLKDLIAGFFTPFQAALRLFFW